MKTSHQSSIFSYFSHFSVDFFHHRESKFWKTKSSTLLSIGNLFVLTLQSAEFKVNNSLNSVNLREESAPVVAGFLP